MQRSEAKEKAKEAQHRYRESEKGKQHIREHYTSREYREHANEYQREYTKRPEVLVKLRMKHARYSTRNSLKERARKVAIYARRSGDLLIPACCDWCGGPADPSELEMHHWRGYDPLHWLDVKFVHKNKCHLECEGVAPEEWV